LRLSLFIATAGVCASLLSGVARADPLPAQGAPPPEDPFESMNRGFYASHNGLDKTFFLPLAKLYRFLTPGFIGEAIHNGLVNLTEPVVIANDVLQARFHRAGQDALRLTANSTAGFLGIMDVATKAGLPHHDNDFGVTLGVWGVKPGPYLFVPLVGPTDVRDLFGEVADTFLNPLLYMRFPGHMTLEIASPIVSGLDTRDRAEPQLQAILGDATDPYATLRSVYLQNRESLVRGEDAAPALPQMDDEPSAPPPDQAAPPADPSATAAPPDQTAPATPDQSTPAPGPSAAEATARAYADAAGDPDAPIATARACDLDGGVPATHGAYLASRD
jgi:phospholipid-binding lipoprotein MlaA